MAQLESGYNFTSKSCSILSLHRALHRGLDFDGFRSIDAKSKQHERYVDGVDGPGESVFVHFALIGEKWSFESL